jgi:hypothetical protein
MQRPLIWINQRRSSSACRNNGPSPFWRNKWLVKVIGRQSRPQKTDARFGISSPFLQNITNAIECRAEQVAHCDVDFARRHFRRSHMIAARD